MPRKHTDKYGYTLIEVLVVVIIMGILSSMGVVGLQGAVANARVKDAAVNTAAFIERVANLSRQMDEVLCLGVQTGKSGILYVVKDNSTSGDCSEVQGVVDSLVIESPSGFVPMSKCGPVTHDWNNAYSANAAFRPKLGLAATPPEGGICIQYGGKDVYGAVRKERTINRVVPMWKVSHNGTKDNDWSNWSEL